MMFDIKKDKWFDVWSEDQYAVNKRNSFDVINKYLQSVGKQPKRILDIGCGRAFESQMLQEAYGCELYLLDGDYDNRNKNSARDDSWGTTDTMSFYNPISKLKEDWNSRDMKYTFVDANNINIDHNIKFDLVYSFLSCGFHYPLNTYSELIKKHTTADSNIIIDFRGKKSVYQQQVHDYELIREIDVGKKHRRSLINLL